MRRAKNRCQYRRCRARHPLYKFVYYCLLDGTRLSKLYCEAHVRMYGAVPDECEEEPEHVETLDVSLSVTDDAECARRASFRVQQTPFGVRVALLDVQGNSVAEVLCDYFDNQFRVKAWNETDNAAEGDPSCAVDLVKDVARAVKRTQAATYELFTGEKLRAA